MHTFQTQLKKLPSSKQFIFGIEKHALSSVHVHSRKRYKSTCNSQILYIAVSSFYWKWRRMLEYSWKRCISRKTSCQYWRWMWACSFGLWVSLLEITSICFSLEWRHTNWHMHLVYFMNSRDSIETIQCHSIQESWRKICCSTLPKWALSINLRKLWYCTDIPPSNVNLRFALWHRKRYALHSNRVSFHGEF